MDFNFSDEQKLIAETAREFSDREILPRVRENDRAERFDRELARQARRGRLPRPDLWTKTMAAECLDYIGYGLIVQENRPRRFLRPHRGQRADLAGRLMGIEKWATVEHKECWLPRFC